jgi:serine/threonine-protein kinase
VGEPCTGDVCARKGYRFIPVDWHESAKAYAAKKQKSLDPLLGRCIDRYLLAGKLGEGGMGAVYLALQRPLNREVALKVISGLELTQSTVSRFEREARAIALLDHANIRKLHDYGIGELEFKVPYMALEYVRHGRTLRHALADVKKENVGQIPGQVVLTIFRQVLHALAAAHAKGIIHRDMKPDNVMIAPEHGNPYMVKILDFGLAKAISDVSGFDGDVSRTGQFLGTPFYMAPEQAPWKGRPEADGRADLYAVAVMLFEVFTGSRPYVGDTPLEVLARKVDPEFDPLGLPEARTLTRPLRTFLAKGLSSLPDDRYPDADTMLDAFEKALSGRATSAVGLARSSATNPSDDRPATPPSPAAAARTEQAAPSGRSSAFATGWPDVVASTVRKRRIPLSRPALLVAGALLAASVAVGAWVVSGSGSGGTPEPMPASTIAPREPAPVTVPAEPDPVAEVESPHPAGTQAVEEPPAKKPSGPRVRFESVPAGAEVVTEGRILGRTAFETDLDAKAGLREFSFRLPGFRDAQVRSDVKDGGVVRAVLVRQQPPRPSPVRKTTPAKRPKKDDYPEL